MEEAAVQPQFTIFGLQPHPIACGVHGRSSRTATVHNIWAPASPYCMWRAWKKQPYSHSSQYLGSSLTLLHVACMEEAAVQPQFTIFGLQPHPIACGVHGRSS